MSVLSEDVVGSALDVYELSLVVVVGRAEADLFPIAVHLLKSAQKEVAMAVF